MNIVTQIDRDKRLRIVFDDENTAIIGRYAILFEERNTVVVGQPFESPAAVWQRVLDTVANMRAVVRRGAWQGREHYFAAIFAGIEPTEDQRKEHLKDWISFCLGHQPSPT